MKRKISIVLAMLLIFQSAWGLNIVSAKQGSEKIMFYDFEDYNAAVGSMEFPDENWGGVDANKKRNYGSDFDSETNSRVIKVNAGGQPLLYFGELFTDGKLHISFDMKTAGDVGGVIRLYDGRSGEDPYVIEPDIKSGYNDKASNTFWVSSDGYYVYYFEGWENGGNDMTAWRNDILPPVKTDTSQWHHFDLVFEEMSKKSSHAWYYCDGEPMNSEGIHFSNGKGFKGLAFNFEKGGVFIDNVYVHHYYDDTENLAAIINNGENVPTENTVLNVKFCEEVNPEVITKDNVVIERSLDGYKISDFEIVSATAQAAEIKLNEALQSGLYTFKINGLTGKNTGAVMNNGINFRTAFQSIDVEQNYYEDDYNAYTAEENAWPDGWLTDSNDNKTNSSAKSITRSDENAAFGIDVSGSNIRRPYYKLKNEIPKNKEITVNFDVYTNSAKWGLYLLNNEPKVNGKTPRNEVIIGGNINDEKLMYANGLSETADKAFGDECILTANEWHNILLKIKPVEDNKTEYTVSVDNGNEYSAISERDFSTSAIKYIGVGVQGKKSENGILNVDNFKISSAGKAYKPEVDTIVLNDYSGETYKTTETIPISIESIDLTFNTEISTDGLEELVVLETNGEKNNAEYILSEDEKVLTLKLKEPLVQSAKYTLTVKEGIKSSLSDTLQSDVPFVQKFSTQKAQPVFDIYNTSIEKSGSNVHLKVNIAKTDSNAYKYTAALCAYDTEEKDGVTFEQMKALKLIPIDLSASDTGYFEYSTDIIPEADTYDEIRAYIVAYPSMELVSVIKSN